MKKLLLTTIIALAMLSFIGIPALAQDGKKPKDKEPCPPGG